jgi:hypothetical protein
MYNGCRELLDKTKRQTSNKHIIFNYIAVRVLQVFSAHGVDVHVLDPLRPTFREIVNESSL